MNSILNNKIKNIEYIFFIKKVKNRVLVKKELKAKIVTFRKRFGLERLLINVINEIKNNILKEKLKKFLVRKFLYRIMEQYIEQYKNEKNYDKLEANKTNGLIKIQKSKKIFEGFLIKYYTYTFLNCANICINNSRLKNIQYNYSYMDRINKTKIYFTKIREITNNSFSKQKKKIMCKLFFTEIKNKILYKKIIIKQKIELMNKKKNFISKNKYKAMDDNNKNNNNLEKDIINIKTKEIYSKYFRLFIRKVKIIKKANYYLKRKIFNLIKNNAKLSKDFKYYLNEARKIK